MTDTTLATAPVTASVNAPPKTSLIAAFTSRLVIIVPYAWLVVLFLVPFLIVFKISLSQTAIAMPPYTPAFDVGDYVVYPKHGVGRVIELQKEEIAGMQPGTKLDDIYSFEYSDSDGDTPSRH